MSTLVIRNLTEEEKMLPLPVQYQIFSQMFCNDSDNKNLKESLLVARTIDGCSTEEDYYETINSLGKSKITDFDIMFTDWINYGSDKVDYDLDDQFKVLIKARPQSSRYTVYYPDNMNEDDVYELVRKEEKELEDKAIGFLGSAAFHGFDNNGDPYVNNLRSSNQVPFGNQQVNVTQPDPSIQNNGDEIVPYQFNFAKQRFTSPEEVLNSVMGVNNQNQQVQMYQQPMYIDQWGNVVYYNPQQF